MYTHHMENTWETGISHLQTQKEKIRGGRSKRRNKNYLMELLADFGFNGLNSNMKFIAITDRIAPHYPDWC